MHLDFTVDVSGWSRLFSAAGRGASDLEPAHNEIGDFLVGEVRGNFESGGGIERWAELRPSTLAERRRKYPSAGIKPLICTRELINSIEKDVQPDYVDVGSALQKARAQFFGQGSIPPRSPFKFRPAVFEKISRIYVRHIFGELVH